MKRLYAFWDNLRVELERIRRLKVSPEALVLDVGSGNRPSPRANVLCDRYLFADAHRFGQALVRTKGRLMVSADITRLPFPDGAFDFVICSHVLEHLDDPAAAIKELQRVAHAGYIETPSPINERLMRYEVHKWIVQVVGDELVFTPKSQPVPDPELASWFAALPDGVRRLIYMRPYQTGLSTTYMWEGTIRYRIEGNLPAAFGTDSESDEHTGSEREIKTGGTLSRLMALYGRWLRRRSDPRIPSLVALLRCPVCKSQVTADAGQATLTCGSCHRKYHMIDDIPQMIPDEA